MSASQETPEGSPGKPARGLEARDQKSASLVSKATAAHLDFQHRLGKGWLLTGVCFSLPSNRQGGLRLPASKKKGRPNREALVRTGKHGD